MYFIICNKDLKILFAIELDDSSHQNQAAKKNDDFKNEFFRKIDIPLEKVTKYNKNFFKWEIRYYFFNDVSI